MNWIKVEDRLPEEHQTVIAYMKNIRNPDIKIQVIQWWTGDTEEISHWMPLPEPPTQ